MEDEVFKRYSPDFKTFEKYGFIKKKDGFFVEKNFPDDLFKAEITVSLTGKVFGTVYETENGEEFLPLRVKSNQGAYVGKIREEYKEILSDIRDKCFVKEYFVLPQTNRIVDSVIKKYGDLPEFLWEKFTGTGVFRNKETEKWYLVILDVDRSKIQKGKKGFVEVLDLKLAPEKIEKLLSGGGFYPGYHMNKKYWITIILDETHTDNEIMKLIDESYGFTLPRTGAKKKPKGKA